jgi:ABC-type phosphate/phosphonate transport system substrate-binding protein
MSRSSMGDVAMIASARMYSWSPSLLAAWRRLLQWVNERSGVPFEVLDPSAEPASLDDLWARPDMACVFMCGYPWVLRESRPHLLAAPVPSPPRFGGRPDYVSDFLVRADSGFKDLADTFGGTIAYSTEHSHSGYNAPRFHLLPHRTAARPQLYSTVLGPFIRQRPVIDAVLDGRADVAAVDGYGLDLLRRHEPALVAQLRIIATTVPAPAPPLVASPGIDVATRERVTAALLSVHEAPAIATTLDELLLTRFVRVEPEIFEIFLERERAAEAAGYAKLG